MRHLAQFLILLSMIASACFARAGEVDRRFEGIWFGVETFQIPAQLLQKGESPFQKPVVIAIGDGGKSIAVAQGFGFGRYQVSAKSNGNELIFEGIGNAFRVGRSGFTRSTLTLSPDGNTLTEKGHAFLPGFPHNVSCNITATLRRQDKR